MTKINDLTRIVVEIVENKLLQSRFDVFQIYIRSQNGNISFACSISLEVHRRTILRPTCLKSLNERNEIKNLHRS